MRLEFFSASQNMNTILVFIDNSALFKPFALTKFST